MKPFKPMLAAKCKDLDKLKYPVLASIKLDGVRATVQGGQLLSRTLKPIPNAAIQKLFRKLPEGLDGELLYGDPTAPDCYRKTVSIVMSEDKSADGVMFWVFDWKCPGGFRDRLAHAGSVHIFQSVSVLSHALMQSRAQLDFFESATVRAGHEGVMVRSLDGPYKEGRSTEREGYLLKFKRFADSEAEVIGVVELMHNGNEAKKNALGRTERSTAKAGKTGTGVLGALKVRDCKTGVEFEIGTGFTAEDRFQYWQQDNVVGRLAKYKYFPSGSKDKPRFPVFIGWRDRNDL